jgi:hypothetical protein
MQVNRRSWTKTAVYCATSSLILPSNFNLYGQDVGVLQAEDHIGDPTGVIEALSFDVRAAEAPLAMESKGPKKDAKKLSQLMADISVAYAKKKVSRANNKGKEVDNFLRLFGLKLKYDNGTFVPYCAAGLSFAACEAYCQITPEVSYDPDDFTTLKSILTDINKYYFKPSPAVRVIKKSAEDRQRWVKPTGITPGKGWPVVFSWKKDGTPNHIGLVIEVDGKTLDGKTLHTVEYNTSSTNDSNGGTVALRERHIDFVLGYVKTY